MIPCIPAFGIAYALKRGAEKFFASDGRSDDWVNGFRMPEYFDVIEIGLNLRSGFACGTRLFTDLGGKSTIYAT
jgi:hypothetical protein